MSIVDNKRISIKVCKLYYEEDLSQKEIAIELGISRPQISRILSNAKKNNTVSIKVNNIFEKETELEEKLKQKYPVHDVWVLKTQGQTDEVIYEEMGKQVSDQLDAYIPNNSLVGVMSGKTISSFVNGLNCFEKKALEFIPLIGGIGSDGADWHANVIAKNFADKINGKYYILNAPVIMKTQHAKESLMNEPHIGNILEKAKKCNVAIVGIGQVDNNSTNVKAGALSPEDMEQLNKIGAKASICCSYLDGKGKTIDSEISQRSIGVTIEELKRCKKIVAIAIGNSKTEAIKSVLLGGFVDVLITNIETANKII
ncbi:MAG: transcriptional regulator [Firmicutes bacterium HGW-Firmicutes-7]|nr:MAG: transcriptional regulator [Firmicutes bacterium HGW-Firmicutes-7]